MSLAHAGWRATKEIRLKKDELEKVMINSEGSQRLLTFRWTLYQNERLVVFRTFDGIVAQHILAKNHHNQSFRIKLASTVPKSLKIPFILIKFKVFDHEKNEALFELMLRDDDEMFVLKYLNEEDVNE